MHERFAEFRVEGTRVGDKGRSNQHVTHELVVRHSHLLDGLAPSLVLTREAVHESIGEVRLALRLLRGGDGVVFVLRRFHQVVLQRRNLVLEFLDPRADAGELIVRGIQLGVGVRERRALGRNLLVDAEVLADVDDPGAKTRGGAGFLLDVGDGKLGHGKVLGLNLSHAILLDVVFVELREVGEEPIDGSHELLRRVPRHVFRNFTLGE